MKKMFILAACCLFSMSAFAQESETTAVTATPETHGDFMNFYAGFGVNYLGDYNINGKLRASGMPLVPDAAPEFAFGFNYSPSDTRWYHDIEASAAFTDEKTATDRAKAVVTSARLRVHYKLVDKEKLFFSAGLDAGYTQTNINLYSRGNTIDLDDLDPSTHTGHISLRNGQVVAGPSVALMLFKTSYPVRINMGYTLGLSNGKWKSDFADVNNTIKENGLGSFYARLSIGF